MQLKRKLRSENECFLAHVNLVDGDVSDAEFPSEMKDLTIDFKYVFQIVCARLPPARNIGHTIPLEFNTHPPFRPIYKLSPLEYAKAIVQIVEYLYKGWI